MAALRRILDRAGALLCAAFLAAAAACGGGGGTGGGGGGVQNLAPTITGQPQSLSVTAGGSASFTVSASGTPAPTFQWRKNGGAIAGATAATYAIPAVQITDAGTYDAVATNVAGSATSAGAVLTVTTPNQAPSKPLISTGPTTAITKHEYIYNLTSTDPEGDAITFSLSPANADAAITGNTLKYRPSVATAQTVTLSVLATDSKGAASTPGTVAVNVLLNRAPVFSSPAVYGLAGTTLAIPAGFQYQATAVDPDGDSLTFALQGAPSAVDNLGAPVAGITVAVDPVSGLTTFAGAVPAGKTSVAITFTVRATDSVAAGFIGDASDRVVTATYTYIPPVPPTITGQPQSLTVTAGQPAAFSVTATGDAPFTYQWRKGGGALAGATAATFNLPATVLADAGSYDVVVGNAGGTATSNPATLTVNPAGTPPSITTHPQSQTAVTGVPVSFTVAATGTAPLAYQWRKNGTALGGATSTTYTIPAVSLSDAGNYDAVVSNGAGSATSNVAILQVLGGGGAGINILLNPGFEEGRVVWGSNDPANVIDNNTSPANHTGGWKGWLGGYSTMNTDTLFQDFTIPAAATSATLTFWLAIATQEPGPGIADLLTLELRNPATNALVASLASYSNLDAGGTYLQRTFDLTSYKGQNLRLFFSGVTNTGNATSWYLDDFSLAVTSPSGLVPVINSFSPGSGMAGTSVTVNGAAFYSLTSVAFNGASATFSVLSPTQLTATVPGGATTGPITATNAAGTGTSAASFSVSFPVPTITALNPGAGPVGTSVTISGTNFSGATAVKFNGTSATFTVNSGTQISTTVPVGATTGTVSVQTAGGTATSPAPFTVNAGGPTLDLSIDSLYVTQSSQTYARGVSLVRGRNGFLRVFAKANQANSATPSVRVRIYNGPTLINTYTIPAPGGSVPTAVSEGSLSSSWNVTLPGSEIQSGYSVLADVDPGNGVAEADEANNQYPANGTPLALGPTIVQPFRTTIIPVTQSSLTGNATVGNLSSWTDRLRRMYPVETVDAQLGAGYATSAVLQSDGTGWNTLLNEIENKRVMEGNQSSRYYYGAVATGYASGVAGLGYIPGSSGSSSNRSAIGWDKTGYTDGGNFPEVFAHEVGHNFGRYHAPCGGPSGIDGSYPYALADIGVYGYDVTNNVLKAPGSFKDIMAYCSPNWVSDYTYKAMMAWRQSDAVHAPPPAPEDGSAPAGPAREVLLVWGRLDHGVWTLEPAFPALIPVTAPASGPVSGDGLAEGFDAAGNRLFAQAFALVPVGCGKNLADEGHFNLAIPLEPATRAKVARIVISRGGLLRAERKPSPLAGLSPARPVAARLLEGATDLVWDDGAYPMAAVRDPVTGEILAFARGGFLTLPRPLKELEILLSDGVQTKVHRVTAAN
ncbi:MAG: immunoglobulin domain-containing protein [Holophagaceae bacterium]|nr:immunoglobulin domain-containing protein [Holophagaceae bacterium]